MSGTSSILNEITSSKKYSFLYTPLITRICEEEIPKYKKDKDTIKAIKAKLHILYGAYTGEGCHKSASRMIDEYEASGGSDIKKLSESIMRLHASTNERLNNISEFYEFIFENTGKAESILDIGCGFNPFALPWMGTGITHYYALDIDYRTSQLLNRYLRLHNIAQLASNIDIVSENPNASADLAFLFKIIPLIEGQRRGRGFQLINEIDARHIVATYPLKSLSGKEKGMRTSYSDSFESSLAKNFSIHAKKIINNELVYIIVKD